MEWNVYFRRSFSKTLILAMKFTTLLIITACLHISAAGFSQGITLSEKNAKLETIFHKIFQQTGYEFFFNSSMLEKARLVSIEVKNAKIDSVLSLCLKDQSLQFTVVEKTIIIKVKPVEYENLISIAGRISNEVGDPLEGVSVLVKNLNRGTVSNALGEFSLRDVPENAILIFSSVGFEQREVKLNSTTSILNVSLKVAVKGLDEMMIIAYGRSSKRAYLGDITKVNSEAIQQQPVNNVLEAIQGRVPGLFIQQVSGVPGSGIIVQIRGQNSIASGNRPLFIVDGVPFTSSSLSSVGRGIIGEANPLNIINPADIENIEVLKDAEATSIYGSKGANGVILINTKKAKAGKTSVTANLNTGIGKASRKMDLLNTRQYLTMRKEGFYNDGIDLNSPGVNAPDILSWDSTRSVDWQQKFFGGTARTNDLELTLSGGSTNTQFRVGAGFRKMTTVFPGDYDDRISSTHLNLIHTSTDQKFRAAFTVSYAEEQNNLFSSDITGVALILPPNVPDFLDDQGNLVWNSGLNPYSYLKQKFGANTQNLLANMNLTYQIIRGLSLKANFGYTQMLRKEIQTNPLGSFNAAYGYTAADTYSDFGNNKLKTWIIEPQLSWQKKLLGGDFDIVAGTTYTRDIREDQTLEGKGYTNESLMEDLQAASTISIINSAYYDYKYTGFFARLGYNLKRKYIISLSGRRDGSSRFGQEKRFANFGAVAAGWVFTEEKFIRKPSGLLSFGKLKASYGVSGNDQISDYQFLELWSPTTYNYGNSIGLFPSRIANPAYAWERNKKMELSLETGFWKDRIYFSAAYFRNRSDNQLVSYSLPPSTGFNSIQDNLPAVVQNSGWEFELTASIFSSKKFSWSGSINFTVPRNKLVDYPGMENSFYRNVYEIGKPLGIYRSLHLTGVNPATGLYEFEDVNKNGSGFDFPEDIQSIKIIGQKYYGGIQNSFQLKNWQFNFFVQFVKQTGKNYRNIFNAPGLAMNQPVEVLDRWQKPGDKKDVQRFTATGSDAFSAYAYGQTFGDFIVDDASFIRLRNVYLSYLIPARVLHVLRIQNSNVFISAQNLFTITKYQGLDPETQKQTLPTLRILNLGIQLTF